MTYDKKYLVWALCYAIAGMGVGIFMGVSQDHAQHVTHAHILLVGFVTSLIYGVIHKLWLTDKMPRLAMAQFIVHHAGAVTMFVGLLLLFANMLPLAQLDPVLALASLTVTLGVVLMLIMVVKSNTLEA